jgi:hypothetical protein
MLFSSGIVTDFVEKNLTMWPYVLFDGLLEVQVIPHQDLSPKSIEYNLITKTKPNDFEKRCNILLQMIDSSLGHKEYHLIVKLNNKQEFSTVQNVRPRKQPIKRTRASKRSRKKAK